MFVERFGVKFWAPDDATLLDEQGRWILDDKLLVPYDTWVAQQNATKIQQEITALQTELQSIAYADIDVKNKTLAAAVNAYNEPLYAYSLQIQARLDELTTLLGSI